MASWRHVGYRRIHVGGGMLGVAAIFLLMQAVGAEDYYQVLGLQDDCTQDDIRKAYHSLALKVKPQPQQCSGCVSAYECVRVCIAALI